MVDLAGFIAFVRSIMGLDASAIPDDSPFLVRALALAQALVVQRLAVAGPVIFQDATYNLAASLLINSAVDVVTDPPSTNQDGTPVLGPFAAMRAKFGNDSFLPGVLTSASDGGTSESIAVADFTKSLTMADLMYLKDPFGRQYFAYAQMVGTLWGVT